MNIKIINGGLMTTVQDMGRTGYQASGMQVSGVMDQYSAAIANALVDNDKYAAVLETTFLGPELEAEADCLVAVAGGSPNILIDGQATDCYRSLVLRKGQKLKFTGMNHGMRSYIAIAGGWEVPPVLGSRSTNLKLKIGGLDGRKLAAGDVLPVGEPSGIAREIIAGTKPARITTMTQQPGDVTDIRVVLGPQNNYFDDEIIKEVFGKSSYTIANESDRMGYRLEGEPIKRRDAKDMITDGIVFGSIQIPPNGQPIVMMADHQTTGGYPKIATVISADLPILAQCTPGMKIRFCITSVAEAQTIYTEYVKKLAVRLEEIRHSAVKQSAIKNFNLKINGQLFQVSVEEI